jgi:putative transferase (TIGR04331 family)
MMFRDKDDHARAFANLDQVDRQMREYLKHLLDEYHGEERPQRYYDILAGYWLQWLAHTVVVALETPRVIRARNCPRLCVACFHTDTNFINRVTSDDGFHRLVRSLLEDQAGAGIDFESATTVFKYTAPSSGGFVRRLVKRCMSKIGNPEAILVCLPYAKCSALDWLLFVLQARKVMRWDDLDGVIPPFEVGIDSNWRLEKFRSVGAGAGGLLEAIKRLLPLFLPVAYLEGFRELRRAVVGIPIGRPMGFYTASALYYHLPFKILAAEHQRTALILGHQHGGSFGMELRHAPEEYERSVCDVFYTWGWVGDDGGTRILSPPAFKRSARRKRWKLMFCLGDFPRTCYRVQFFPVADGATRTIEDTLIFARSVPLSREKRVLIRPSPTDYGRGWVKELRCALPAAQMDGFEKRAIERFSESQIVFHNYISTGWLESIWLDIPTLALYDTDVYAFRADMVPHVALFEQFGLLHRSGTSAARFYGAISEDIAGWWNQREFRRARTEFVARYVGVKSDWKKEWIREFSWLLENCEAVHTRSAPRLAGLQSANNAEMAVRP